MYISIIQDMLPLGLRPVLGYVLNALIVVSMFLLATNILQLTLLPLVSAVRINLNFFSNLNTILTSTKVKLRLRFT